MPELTEKVTMRTMEGFQATHEKQFSPLCATEAEALYWVIDRLILKNDQLDKEVRALLDEGSTP